MIETDLSLVPVETLINEIISRTEGMVIAFMQFDDGNNKLIRTNWSNDCYWMELLGMSNALNFQLNVAHEEQTNLEDSDGKE